MLEKKDMAEFYFKAENVFVRFLQDPWCATSNQRRHPYTFDQKLHRTSL